MVGALKLEVRSQRSAVRFRRGLRSEGVEFRSRFNDESICRVSTCASKRLPDS